MLLPDMPAHIRSCTDSTLWCCTAHHSADELTCRGVLCLSSLKCPFLQKGLTALQRPVIRSWDSKPLPLPSSWHQPLSHISWLLGQELTATT